MRREWLFLFPGQKSLPEPTVPLVKIINVTFGEYSGTIQNLIQPFAGDSDSVHQQIRSTRLKAILQIHEQTIDRKDADIFVWNDKCQFDTKAGMDIYRLIET